VKQLLLLLCTASVLLCVSSVQAKDRKTLADLRRALVFAQSADQTNQALDDLTARIGEDPGFVDHGAFGDWLGELPTRRAKHPRIQQRRGWAYVVAKRGTEAVTPLQVALKDNPSDGLTRAYLGEALRQAGRHTEALSMLATAIVADYREPHVKESAIEAALSLRRDTEAVKGARGLPAYATGLIEVRKARVDAELDSIIARWLLWDLRTHDKPTSTRGRLWAKTAATHALASIAWAQKPLPGSDQLAFDAGVALEAQDLETGGRTARFDLLSHACRLGAAFAQDGPHRVPAAYTHLAEAASAMGRYELAGRLVRKRLEISFSPRAWRLLGRLPPDVAD
jgi:tetratricopeptide (TPR) repeat protein